MASIQKLANGNFKATVSLGRDANGKQIRKTITCDSEKECKRRAREIEQDYEDGKYININKIKFSKWADEWFSLNKSRLSPSTLQSYRIYIEKHFKPFFGNYKVSQINTIIVKRYIATKLEDLSSTTVRKHFYVLSAMLEDILKYKNPCHDIDPPPIADFKHHVVTDQEYKKIREFFRGRSYEIIILLGALCGMRRGEIFALKWDDIDYNNQTIRVDTALSISEADKGYIEKSTKSKNGIRTVVAPEEIFDLLKKRWKKQKKISDRIFPSRPDNFSSWFAECMESLGLNIRFHDLRHYHATWLYNNGIPDLFAAQRLGDDLNTIKTIYQHIAEDKATEINKEILKKIGTI